MYLTCTLSFDIFGSYSTVFWPIRLTRLYSALYSGNDSDGFGEVFGAFWADSDLFVIFGSIWLDDSGRYSRNETNRPESAQNAPIAFPNPTEYIPNMARMWPE